MRRDWIDLLDEVVEEVFSLMLGSSCRPEPDSIDGANHLSAMVSFSGALEGECILQLGREAAGSLSEKLVGEADESLWPDAAGEICNMIAGTWKSRLQGDRAACKLSAPEVMEGPARMSPPELFAEITHRFYRTESVHLSLVLSLS